MLSVEECKKCLGLGYASLSDEEIKEVRDKITEFINVLWEEDN